MLFLMEYTFTAPGNSFKPFSPTTPGLVSVIIPCYNGERYIEQAIRSCLSQTYRNLEIIVVDNGSTDDSRRIAESFDPQVRVIHEPKKGLHHARNAGLANCSGEFVQFLDCDDLLNQDKIEKQVFVLRCNPRIDIIYGSGYYFQHSIEQAVEPIHVIRQAKDYATALLANHMLTVHSALIRKWVIDNVGPADTDLSAQEDWDYWLRAARFGFHFHYDPQGICYYRKHANQMTNNSEVMIRGMHDRLEKTLGMFGPEPMTPGQNQALLKAYLDLLDWYDHSLLNLTGRQKVVGRILDLARLIEHENYNLAAVPGSELYPIEAALLPLRLAQLSPNDIFPSAAELLDEGEGRVEMVLMQGWPEAQQMIPLRLFVESFFVKLAHGRVPAWQDRMIELFKVIAHRCPEEIMEKTLPSLYGAKSLRRQISGLFGEKGCRIGFYGSGAHTYRLLCLSDFSGCELVGIADDDPGKIWSEKIAGMNVMSPQDLAALKPDAVVVSSDQYQDMMIRKCRSFFQEDIRIITLYENRTNGNQEPAI